MSEDNQTPVDIISFHCTFNPSVDTLQQSYPFGVYFEFYPKAHHKYYCFIRDQGITRVHLFCSINTPGVPLLTATPHESRVLTAIQKEAGTNSLFIGEIEYVISGVTQQKQGIKEHDCGKQ